MALIDSSGLDIVTGGEGVSTRIHPYATRSTVYWTFGKKSTMRVATRSVSFGIVAASCGERIHSFANKFHRSTNLGVANAVYNVSYMMNYEIASAPNPHDKNDPTDNNTRMLMFRSRLTLEQRKVERRRIAEFCTNRVPIIAEPGSCDTPRSDKEKFLSSCLSFENGFD